MREAVYLAVAGQRVLEVKKLTQDIVDSYPETFLQDPLRSLEPVMHDCQFGHNSGMKIVRKLCENL